MAEQTPPAPAAPAAPPPSRNDRVQAAIKEAVALEASKAPAPSNEKAPGAPEKAEAPKDGAPPKPPDAPVKAEDKSFEKLLREKAALRPYLEAAKVMPMETLQALAKAQSAKDPIAVLKALGYSYDDVAAKVAEVPAPKKAPNADVEESPTVLSLKQEVEALRRERQAEQGVKLRSEALAKTREFVKGKFSHIEGLEAEDQVLNYIENYFRQTGEMPGTNFEETVELASAAVEKDLQKQAERWKKVLTPANPEPTVEPESTRNAPSAGTGIVGKTLTNSTTAPMKGVPEPKTRAELLKSLESDPNIQW